MENRYKRIYGGNLSIVAVRTGYFVYTSAATYDRKSIHTVMFLNNQVYFFNFNGFLRL